MQYAHIFLFLLIFVIGPIAPSEGAAPAKPSFEVFFEGEITSFLAKAHSPESDLKLLIPELIDLNNLGCGQHPDYPLDKEYLIGPQNPEGPELQLYLKLSALNAAFSLNFGELWGANLGTGFSQEQKQRLQIIQDISTFIQKAAEISEKQKKDFEESYVLDPPSFWHFAPESLRYLTLAAQNPVIDGLVQSLWAFPKTPMATPDEVEHFKTKIFTKEHLTDFAKMLYSDLPQSKPIEEEEVKGESLSNLKPSYTYYYNNDGYESEYADNTRTPFDPKKIKDGDIRGEPLSSTKGDPIGYNLYLPKGDIKALVIKVYGGGSTVEQPHELIENEKAFLAKNIALIKLNLVDLKELNVVQSAIPEELYNRVFESVHDFWEILTKTPERFGHALKIPLDAFKDKPIFLWGESFGGRVAVRHAELYPHTYHGYISQEGGFYWGPAISDGHLWLDAVLDDQEIQKLSDPILLIQNYDDNRVRATHALTMYKKAQEQGKAHLVRLWVNREGSPLSTYSHDNTIKGHHSSSDPKIFGDMMDVMLQFIDYPNVPLIPLHEWRQHKYSSYYRFENEWGWWPIDKLLTKDRFSPTDWFLKDAYHLYKKLPPLEQKAFVKELRDLVSKTLTTNNGVPVLWNRYMDPIMCGIPLRFRFRNTDKKDLINLMRDVFSEKALDHQVRKALRFLLPGFIKYMKERHPSLVPTPLDDTYFDKIANHPQTWEQVRLYFEEPSNLLLNAYLRANPETGSIIIRSQPFLTIVEDVTPWNANQLGKLKSDISKYRAILRMATTFKTYPEVEDFLAYANEEDKAGMGGKMQKDLLDIIDKESKLIKQTFKAARHTDTFKAAVHNVQQDNAIKAYLADALMDKRDAFPTYTLSDGTSSGGDVAPNGPPHDFFQSHWGRILKANKENESLRLNINAFRFDTNNKEITHRLTMLVSALRKNPKGDLSLSYITTTHNQLNDILGILTRNDVVNDNGGIAVLDSLSLSCNFQEPPDFDLLRRSARGVTLFQSPQKEELPLEEQIMPLPVLQAFHQEIMEKFTLPTLTIFTIAQNTLHPWISNQYDQAEREQKQRNINEVQNVSDYMKLYSEIKLQVIEQDRRWQRNPNYQPGHFVKPENIRILFNPTIQEIHSLAFKTQKDLKMLWIVYPKAPFSAKKYKSEDSKTRLDIKARLLDGIKSRKFPALINCEFFNDAIDEENNAITQKIEDFTRQQYAQLPIQD